MVLGLPLWAITCLLGSSEGLIQLIGPLEPLDGQWSLWMTHRDHLGPLDGHLGPLDSHFGLQDGHSGPLEGHLGHLDGHFLGLLDNYLGSLALWAHSIGP